MPVGAPRLAGRDSRRERGPGLAKLFMGSRPREGHGCLCDRGGECEQGGRADVRPRQDRHGACPHDREP